MHFSGSSFFSLHQLLLLPQSPAAPGKPTLRMHVFHASGAGGVLEPSRIA
jgi:hypothetical protein